VDSETRRNGSLQPAVSTSRKAFVSWNTLNFVFVPIGK
jgi:hypothetical protein